MSMERLSYLPSVFCILVSCLFSFVCSHAQTITLTNSGVPAVNGTYTYVKLLNDKPSYGKGIYRIYWDQNQWVIESNTKVFYTNQDQGLWIQAFGWELGPDGTEPYPEFSGDVITLGLNLVDFQAKITQGGKAQLTWSHYPQKQLQGFDIQRSGDGIIWEKIGQINASQSNQDIHHYLFLDQYPLSGQVMYRIKQYDSNGLFSYSQQIKLHIEDLSYQHLFVLPNRSVSQGTISIEVLHSTSLSDHKIVNLRNIQGRTLHQWEIVTSLPYKIHLPKLMSVIYIIETTVQEDRLWSYLMID